MKAQAQTTRADDAQTIATCDRKAHRTPGSSNARCTPRMSAAVMSATLSISEAVAQSRRGRVEPAWSTCARARLRVRCLLSRSAGIDRSRLVFTSGGSHVVVEAPRAPAFGAMSQPPLADFRVRIDGTGAH
eukprot:6214513-Pleurochrysis_carterae.AAC.4